MILNASAEKGSSSAALRSACGAAWGGRGALRVRGVVVRQVALDRRDVDRRRQIVHHRVQQRLDALVLEGGAGEYRDDLPGNRRLAQHRADLVFGELVLFQVLVQ